VEELIDAMAADLLFQAKACVRTFGDFQLALSGGSTPEPFYRRLMYDPSYRDLPWKRTHLWLVDERCVPEDDERSNFKMIHETIVAHSDIPREQVHPMSAAKEGADAAYEQELRDILGWREKGHDRLDFVVLGMGADGHTASLFPGSPALRAKGPARREELGADGDAAGPGYDDIRAFERVAVCRGDGDGGEEAGDGAARGGGARGHGDGGDG
jgi:6-phosphogluconolactonase